MRSRPLTDRYLAAVEAAAATAGRWLHVRDFGTEANARVTAACLSAGYLRVKPRDGDREVRVNGTRYIATAAPVETRVEPASDVWRLFVRVPPARG